MRFLFIVLCMLIGASTQALPLLAENAALNPAATLTLYPDHQDPNKFYFFPNSSRFAQDERKIPLFSFTYWGLTNPSSINFPGAYMVYTARLESDDLQKKALSDFLASHPQARVSVIPVQSSTISLTSTSEGLPLRALFEEFNFAPRGGMAETEVAVNAVLTAAGAKAFRALLLSEAGASLKTDYCYELQGLGPSMDANVRVDMERVYEHFRTSVSGGGLWWRHTIQTEIEKLRQQNLVRWEINGGNASDQEYLASVTDQIVKRLFVPELQARPGEFGGSEGWFNINATYTFREDNKVETWAMTRRDLVTKYFCNALLVKDIAPYKDKLIIDADKTH